MASTWKIRILFLLMFAPITTNDKEGQSADTLPTCMPFSAIFIWHTGGGDDTSFYQQKRLIIKLILDFPECTEVSLVRVGAKVNTKMHFRKESTNQSWIYQLSKHHPGHSETHVIPNRKISDAILRNENHKIAEEVFLVVNNNSVIADKQEAAKALRKKNTWIIFSGEPTSKHVWTDLATDIYHFVILEDNTGSITCTAKFILIQTCRDIIPDTDSIMDDHNSHIDVHSTINSIIIVMIIYYCLHERVKRNLQSLCSTCFRKDNTPVAEHGVDGQDQELNDRNENQFTKEQLDLDANASTTVEGEILDMTVAGRQSNLPIPPIARQDFEQEEHPLINQQNGNGEQT